MSHPVIEICHGQHAKVYVVMPISPLCEPLTNVFATTCSRPFPARLTYSLLGPETHPQALQSHVFLDCPKHLECQIHIMSHPLELFSMSHDQADVDVDLMKVWLVVILG